METRVNENKYWMATLFKSIGDAVITADGLGMIRAMNGAAEALTGWTCKEAVGQEVNQVLKLRDAKTLLPVENHISRVLHDGLPVTVSTGLLLISRDSTAIPTENSAAAVMDTNGKIAGVILTFRGTAEPRPTAEALEEVLSKVQQAKREWESTVDSLSDLVLLIDNSGQIIRANRTVESWNLGDVKEVSGRPMHELLHPGCVNADCYLDSMVKKLAGRTTDGQSVEQENYDRILNRYLLIKARPVHDPHRQVVQAAVVVLQDITERKQAEETLRRYAAELEARNQELDAFAHTVAHDLKNPAGIIIGFSKVLEDGHTTISDSQRLEIAQALSRTGHKMNSIIDELLLLAELRDAQVETGPLDMRWVVAEAQQSLEHMILKAEAELVMVRPEAWPKVVGYAPWLEQVWVNYISNALKYGGAPPRIELGATEQLDGRVRFWVRDYGPGLAPEQQAQLFAPFAQLQHIRPKGHGLGLSIVRRIMEKLGGHAGVESKGVSGQGSIFYFTLPAAIKADVTLQQERALCAHS
jgi:PAS domain S-box-containing protein